MRRPLARPLTVIAILALGSAGIVSSIEHPLVGDAAYAKAGGNGGGNSGGNGGGNGGGGGKSGGGGGKSGGQSGSSASQGSNAGGKKGGSAKALTVDVAKAPKSHPKKTYSDADVRPNELGAINAVLHMSERAKAKQMLSTTSRYGRIYHAMQAAYAAGLVTSDLPTLEELEAALIAAEAVEPTEPTEPTAPETDPPAVVDEAVVTPATIQAQIDALKGLQAAINKPLTERVWGVLQTEFTPPVPTPVEPPVVETPVVEPVEPTPTSGEPPAGDPTVEPIVVN